MTNNKMEELKTGIKEDKITELKDELQTEYDNVVRSGSYDAYEACSNGGFKTGIELAIGKIDKILAEDDSKEQNQVYEALMGTLCYFGYYRNIPKLIKALKENPEEYPECCKDTDLAFLYTLCANMFDYTCKYIRQRSVDKSIEFLTQIMMEYHTDEEEVKFLIESECEDEN